MEMAAKSCETFVEELAGSAPVPGGGGASALVGAIGVALGNMVGSLTVGKKKYQAVQEEILALKDRAEELQKRLLSGINRDAEAFAPLAAAYGLPSGTDQEKEEKAKIMEGALEGACQAPLEIMELCCEAIAVLEGFAEKGSAIAISDAGVGAVCCQAALRGASLNVFINTKSMKNRTRAEEINRKAEAMLLEYTRRAEEIFTNVRGRF